MGLLPSRSVELRISNKTRNFTLRNTRISSSSKRFPASPMPVLPPGSSDTCYFQSTFWSYGAEGGLAYEAKSFTLDIYFSNPIDYNKSPMALGLMLSAVPSPVLSPRKAHLGRLENICARMANGTYSRSRVQFKYDHVIVDKNHRTVQVSSGPIKVTATMSYATDSLVEVVLEEQEVSWEEAGTENPSLEVMEKLLSMKTHVQK